METCLRPTPESKPTRRLAASRRSDSTLFPWVRRSAPQRTAREHTQLMGSSGSDLHRLGSNGLAIQRHSNAPFSGHPPLRNPSSRHRHRPLHRQRALRRVAYQKRALAGLIKAAGRLKDLKHLSVVPRRKILPIHAYHKITQRSDAKGSCRHASALAIVAERNGRVRGWWRVSASAGARTHARLTS